MRNIVPIVGALIISTILSFLVLSSSYSYADSVTSNATVIVPASCNLSSNLDTAHTATINPGQSQSDIGTTTFKVICNDNSGFSLYAIGYSNEEYGNTKLLATINSQLSPANDIVTGTATSGSVSNWAMKLTPVSGTYAPTISSDVNGSFASYHIVPETYTKVATFLSSTDASIGSSVQSTYRAYIASTQPAGTYAGKVRYTLVHPASEVPAQPQTTQSGKICYYANVSDAVGTMGCQDVASSVTLLASNFSRAGYGFAGWSDAFDYAENSNAHFYGPNEDITLTPADYQSPNNGLSLYAVWVKSEGNLQGWTGCSSLTKADTATDIFSQSITALTDQRDNQTYAIAKLTDNNCWMIENLRLDDSAILTPTNTNNPLSDGTTVSLKHNYTDTDTYNTLSPTSNVAYNADTAPEGWCTTNSAACDDQSRLRTDNTASRASYASGATMDGNANIYGYGNYYNWYSATAGNGTYSTGSGVVANGDICPAGWHLPYGGSGTGTKGGNTSGGFYYLNYKLNNDRNLTDSVASNKLRSYPQNFVYSGFNGASVYNRSSYGYYWSSTAYSSIRTYYLFFYSSSVSPGTGNGNKFSGSMARCIVSGS